jgi:phosphoribosylformimino-5-aminoimidazole carboxamide ribotide isomerase
VRLIQGKADQQTVYAENPVLVAEGFKQAGSGWVHVVDLDGAFDGEPKNLDTVKAITATGLRVQLGGGLRSKQSVERALAMGVSRVVIGTRAAESESFVAELVASFGDKIAVGIDAKDGKVAIKGWVDTTNTGALTMAKHMDDIGVSTLIYTDIGTDGMLTGPNLVAQEAMLKTVRCRVIASGGVSVRDDVSNLNNLAKKYPNLDGVIVGKAIYEGRVQLPDLLALVKA